MEHQALLAATLFAISGLVVCWWSLMAFNIFRQPIYLGLLMLSILGTVVGWFSIRMVESTWMIGLGLSLLITTLVLSFGLDRFEAVQKPGLRLYATIVPLLAVAILSYSTPISQTNQGITSIEQAIARQQQEDISTLHSVDLPSDLSGVNSALTTLQINQGFDMLLWIDNEQIVRARADQPSQVGMPISQIVDQLNGLVTLPSDQLAEVVSMSKQTGELVAIRIFNPNRLNLLDSKDSWAIATPAGIIASQPSVITATIWQSPELDQWARSLSNHNSYERPLVTSTKTYTLVASPLTTADQSQAYLFLITHV